VRLRLRDGLVKLSQKCISDDTYLPNIFTHLLQSLDDVEVSLTFIIDLHQGHSVSLSIIIDYLLLLP